MPRRPRQHVDALGRHDRLLPRRLDVDQRHDTLHRHRLLDAADGHRGVDVGHERALQHDDPLADHDAEARQGEGHRVGARRQVGDLVVPGAVREDRAHLLDESRAARLDGHAGQDAAHVVDDGARDAGLTLGEGRGGGGIPKEPARSWPGTEGLGNIAIRAPASTHLHQCRHESDAPASGPERIRRYDTPSPHRTPSRRGRRARDDRLRSLGPGVQPARRSPRRTAGTGRRTAGGDSAAGAATASRSRTPPPSGPACDRRRGSARRCSRWPSPPPSRRRRDGAGGRRWRGQSRAAGCPRSRPGWPEGSSSPPGRCACRRNGRPRRGTWTGRSRSSSRRRADSRPCGGRAGRRPSASTSARVHSRSGDPFDDGEKAGRAPSTRPRRRPPRLRRRAATRRRSPSNTRPRHGNRTRLPTGQAAPGKSAVMASARPPQRPRMRPRRNERQQKSRALGRCRHGFISGRARPGRPSRAASRPERCLSSSGRGPDRRRCGPRSTAGPEGSRRGGARRPRGSSRPCRRPRCSAGRAASGRACPRPARGRGAGHNRSQRAATSGSMSPDTGSQSGTGRPSAPRGP